jgi:hypothetical protein
MHQQGNNNEFMNPCQDSIGGAYRVFKPNIAWETGPSSRDCDVANSKGPSRRTRRAGFKEKSETGKSWR